MMAHLQGENCAEQNRTINLKFTNLQLDMAHIL